MSDMQIIRPKLGFESEFGQHRNWWVRDPRLVGNPLSILLFLLSHDHGFGITQTEARQRLEIGKDAWGSAKQRLLRAGFLIEVRDRFPDGYVDRMGQPRGRQRRFRLFLQDPPEGLNVPLEQALIEIQEPYEDYLAAAGESVCGLSAHERKNPDQADGGLSAHETIPTAENPHTAENPQSFKEEKTVGWLVGSINQFEKRPTDRPNRVAGPRAGVPTLGALAVSAIDSELDALLPGVGLTFAAIAREVDGRADLSRVDVVRAVKDIVLRSKKPVARPAAAVGAVIARKPTAWLLGATPEPRAWVPAAPEPEARPESAMARCKRGVHWWGAEALPEIERSHCGDCGTPRRNVDPAFADLETDFDFGGDS